MYGVPQVNWSVSSMTKREGSAPIIFRDEFPGHKTLSEVVEYMIGYKSADRHIVRMKIKKITRSY